MLTRFIQKFIDIISIHKTNRHSIEKQYNREVTPTEFDTENTELVKEYMERQV